MHLLHVVGSGKDGTGIEVVGITCVVALVEGINGLRDFLEAEPLAGNVLEVVLEQGKKDFLVGGYINVAILLCHPLLEIIVTGAHQIFHDETEDVTAIIEGFYPKVATIEGFVVVGVEMLQGVKHAEITSTCKRVFRHPLHQFLFQLLFFVDDFQVVEGGVLSKREFPVVGTAGILGGIHDAERIALLHGFAKDGKFDSAHLIAHVVHGAHGALNAIGGKVTVCAAGIAYGHGEGTLAIALCADMGIFARITVVGHRQGARRRSADRRRA